ncbi:DUF4175 domain-containing protein [Alkalibacillus almallahensis]|uniref:DUF4175 domain-containing protein n=1 Tax=Alkalibacillus almallahensis TaxID=1379154 RepID=UPI00142194B5|nr:DUF4175 domain-containing protein [Alkalibacillus almallahensis]NIK10771.1 hypothetical protein [Alkalibacillus almallahensis]
MAEVNKVFQSIRTGQANSNQVNLREGQVVSGRVMKFFPDNKAAVQLGQQQVVAQLNANLQSNQNYLLQVNRTNPNLHLQVVSEEPVRSPMDAARTLLNASHQQASRQETTMLAQMLREQLPVSQQNVGTLLSLARSESHDAQTVLREMLTRQFPLTEQTFKAVDQRINNPLSVQQTLSQMQGQLGGSSQLTNAQMQLSLYIQALSGNQISNQQMMAQLTHQILSEIGRGSETTFQMLQKAGVIGQQTTFAQWSSTWSNWALNNQITFNIDSSGAATSTNLTLPYNLTADQVQSGFQQLANQQLPGGLKTQQLMQSFMNQLSQLQQAGTERLNFLQNVTQLPVFNQVQSNLSSTNQQTMQQLVQFLNQNQGTQAQQLLNSDSGQQLMQNLNQLLGNQLTSEQSRGLQIWQNVMQSSQPTNMQQMMHQFQTFFNMTQQDHQATNRMQQALAQVQNQLSQPNQQMLQQVLQAVNQNQPAQVQQLLSSENGQQLMQQLAQFNAQSMTQQDARAMQVLNNMMQQLLTQPQQSASFNQVMQQLQAMFNQQDMVQAQMVRQDYPGMGQLLQATFAQTGQESFGQMNQVLQAMHLSMQDTAKDWMQFSAQLPKEMLGLNEDLWMDFEGQRQADGSIHPQNCRVMFYLDLPNLEQTVLDMRVKQGEVSLDIYHENPKELEPLVNGLTETLKLNLRDKQYELNQIQVKPIEKQLQNPDIQQEESVESSYKGVDFRV